MRLFLKRLLIFFVFFFVFDKLFLLLRNYLPGLEVDRKLEMVLNGKFNHDVIILGSSVGARDILASQLADSLQTTAYNLAFPGANTDFQEFVWRQFLAHPNRRPKLVILTIDEPANFFADKIVTFRLDRLYPLVRYPEIRKEMVARGEKNKYLSTLFILHQLNKSNLDLRKKKFSASDTIRPCGSMPAYVSQKPFSGRYHNGNKPYPVEHEQAVLREKFISLVNSCQQAHIPLLIVVPPRFHSRNYHFEKRVKQLIPEGIMMYAFDENRGEFKDKKFFSDAVHLNIKGARIFTNDLSDFIRENRLLP